MSQVKTHYDNLQVKETASDEVIKGAYRYLSQKWHPDKNPHNREEAERILRIINQAYAVLSNPSKRKEHDDWIRRQRGSADGATQSPPPPPPPPPSPPPYTQEQPREYTTQPVAAVRPWVRYWARTLDVCIFAPLAGAAIGFAYPAMFATEANDQVWGLAFLFMWIFAESILLSTFGTTPGKWFFKIKIAHKSGEISFDSALARSFKVWWRGMGIGFPIATLITHIVAYNKLTKNGVTTWDSDDGFTVTHERIGAIRVILAVLFFFVFFVFVAAMGSA